MGTQWTKTVVDGFGRPVKVLTVRGRLLLLFSTTPPSEWNGATA